MKGFDLHTPHDADVSPFDPAGSPLVSLEVGPALRELANLAAVSASPGFTWGRKGQIKNAYLLNDTVPSNTSGRMVPVNGAIFTVFVSSKNNSTGVVQIRKRVGASLVTIATVSMAGQRTITVLLATPAPVVKNDELAVFVTNAAEIRNPVVGIIIKGTI